MNFSNIAANYLSKQQSGNGFQNILQVPPEILSRYSELLSQVAPIITAIHSAAYRGPPYSEEFLQLLKKFRQQLYHSPSLEVAVSDQNESQDSNQLAVVFRREGGVNLLISLLLSSSHGDSHTNNQGIEIAQENSKTPSGTIRVQDLCLIILKQLSLLDSECSLVLTTCPELLVHCFQLLKSTLASSACDLIEHIFLSQNDLVHLDGFKKLAEMLQHLDDESLSQTYRVLSLSVSDVDECENRASLLAQRRQKQGTRAPEVTVSSLNRDFVIAIPGFLDKVLNYACKLPYSPRYPLPSTEREQWTSWIDNNLSASNSSVVTVSWLPPAVHEQMLAVFEDAFSDDLPSHLTRRVDALYLLSLLLTGSQRAKVQEMLAKNGIGPSLCALFEQFIWKSPTPRQATIDTAGQCNCSPEMILKIQLLRLVHNFCSHSTFKHVLLSYAEMEELKQLYTAHEDPSFNIQSLGNSNLPFCTESMGLLSRIIRVLKTVPTSSIFRFWLCRAVESWLRSSSNFGVADQIFVINRGLLQHIVNVLLEKEPGDGALARNRYNALGSAGPPREVAQSSFDLLGEMIRFNLEACRQLDLLLNTDKNVNNFLDVVHGNLIDSNMFLRSVFLTMDHCMDGTSGRHNQVSLFFPSSRFFSYFLHLRRRVSYLALLISSISVDTLTLENVSCLNTALIILMLAARQGTLITCLKMLATSTVDQLRLGGAYRCGPSGAEGTGPQFCMEPRHILSSLFHLLRFWRVHYQPGDQSCISLEKGSGIAFEEWVRTIDMLTSTESTSCYSLLHYLPEEQSFIIQSWDIDMECG